MIKRVANKHDRRFILLSLTRSGNKIAEKCTRKITQLWAELISDFGEQEIEQLDVILEKISVKYSGGVSSWSSINIKNYLLSIYLL